MLGSVGGAMTTTLFVLCGLPASGKSTFAAELAKSTGAFVLTVDAIRTHDADPAEVFAQVSQALGKTLADGHSAIVDTCCLHGFQRARWLMVGRRAGVRVELVLVVTPWRKCAERNAERERPASVSDWLYSARLMSEAASLAPLERFDDVHFVAGDAPYQPWADL